MRFIVKMACRDVEVKMACPDMEVTRRQVRGKTRDQEEFGDTMKL